MVGSLTYRAQENALGGHQMGNTVVQWAVAIILKALQNYLTPDKIKEFETAFITLLRTEAKTIATGTLETDVETVVEVLATALGVPPAV